MKALRNLILAFAFFALLPSCDTAERKVVIGISQGQSDYADGVPAIKESYINSVYLAGAQPVLIPMTYDKRTLRRIVRKCDGVILTGGCDVEPWRYAQTPRPMLGDVSPMRDSCDFALLDAALDAGKPVLGICRGEQLINVRFGGTLYQDIPSEHPDSTVSHRGPYTEKAHAVTFESSTRIGKAFGADTLEVNSCHHQAVCDLAPGFIPCAWSPDGLVEAFESEQRPILAVQFHPEAFAQTADPAFLPFFRYFISICR